jgi:diacylglycerol kinase
MDYIHPDIAIQARTSSPRNVLTGLRKVFISDPGLTFQILLFVPLITGGIVLQLNPLQWALILLVSLFFVIAGVFRRAALLQISHEANCSTFHVSRIKAMGNAIVAITGGISLLTYLLIFVPKIITLI